MKDKSLKAAKATPPEYQRMARGPLAVGAVAGKITRPLLGKRGLAEGDLIAHWEAIVGADLAPLALPEQLRFPKGKRENGELMVRCGSGPAAVLIQHETPRILERITRFFGYPAVTRLKIHQAPLPILRKGRPPPPPPLAAAEQQSIHAAVAEVEDPALRAVLERLGTAIAQAEKRKRGKNTT